MSQLSLQAESVCEKLVRYYLSAAILLVVGATIAAPVALLMAATLK